MFRWHLISRSAGDYDTGRGLMTSPPPPPGPIQPRAHELEPLDVASHLHLLGESLSLIGTRLKERDVSRAYFVGQLNLFFRPHHRDKLPFREVFRFYWTPSYAPLDRCCVLLALIQRRTAVHQRPFGAF